MNRMTYDSGWKCWSICFVALFMNMTLDGATNSFGVIKTVVYFLNYDYLPIPKQDYDLNQNMHDFAKKMLSCLLSRY